MKTKSERFALDYDVLINSIIQTDRLIEFGRQQALASGTLKPITADLDVLRAYARSVARDSYMSEFDPTRHEQDRLRAADHDRVVAAIEEAELVRAHARGAHVAADRAFAEVKPAGTEPGVHWLIETSAISVMALSFAPTIHDRVLYSIDDWTVAWAAAAICGITLASFITWMMTQTIATVGRAGRALNWLGLGAGLTFGLAAGLLRWSIVDSDTGRMMAVGMTLLEMCTVLYLEWLAISLRSDHNEWRVRSEARQELTATLDAAARRAANAEQVVAELQARSDEHARHVDERWVRSNKCDQIEKAAIDATVQGYSTGVNENLGYTRGLRRVV